MKKACIMLFVLFLHTAQEKVHSQNKIQFIGVLSDSLSNPINEAIINVFSQLSGKFLTASLSNTKGYYDFELDILQPLKIYLQAAGFKSKEIIYSPSCDSCKFIQLEKEKLHSEANQLKEVVVASKVPLIEVKPGMTIFNPNEAISTGFNTAFDVVAKSPGVQINQSGEIKLKGKTGTLIYLDDKPITLAGNDLENFLRSIPSENVKQVQLITIPPASYEAAGGSGIIHIKTKRSKINGLNGNATLNYGQGRYARSSNSFNVNFNSLKVSLFSNLGFTSNNHYQDLVIQRTYKNEDLSDKNYFNQRTYIKVKANSFNCRLGGDIMLNYKTTIGFSSRSLFNFSKIKRNNIGGLSGYKQDIQTDVLAYNTDKSQLINNSFNLNLRHSIDSMGKKITFDADHVTYNSELIQEFNNTIYTYSTLTNQQDQQTGQLPSNISIYSIKSDFTFPSVKFGTLETGVKYNETHTNNEAIYSITEHNITTPNYDLSNHFKYNENILAAYINFSQSIKQLEFQIGVRTENTELLGQQLGNKIIPSSTFKRSYTNVFPTIFASYKIDSLGKHILAFSSGKRIDRPYFKDLNPFVSPLDKLTFYAGNPFLTPSLTNNFLFSYSIGSFFGTEFSYNQSENLIKETIEMRDGIYYSRPGNIGSTKQYNINFQFNFNASKNYAITLFNEFNYSEYKSKLYTENLNSHGVYGFIQITNRFNLPKNYSLELSGEYLSTITESQFIIGDFGHLSVGLQKKLFQSKGNLKLNVSDLLFTNKIRGTINNLALAEAQWRSARDTRVVSISINYRFGKNKQSSITYESNSIESEKKRLK